MSDVKSFSDSYKEAGVDITSGYESVRLMKEHIERTKTAGVLSSVGGFGGLFMPDLAGMQSPVFVSGTDGVGTKLKIAFLMDKHDTVGIDCVAMCANDIICAGAKPLFFLDYIAMGKNIPQKVADIVKGISDGCVMADMALIGGETAEMPGFYANDEYDLAGFCVGVVDKDKIIDKERVKEGDIIIALPSSGVHSNGFSLIRHVFHIERHGVHHYIESLGATLGQVLLTPTKIYVKPILELIKSVDVKGISNITGGGFYENIPRSIASGLGAKIDKSSIVIPPIFDLIQKTGDIPERDMFNTFNMGVGMTVIVSPQDGQAALDILKQNGEQAYVIGEIAKVDGVELW